MFKSALVLAYAALASAYSPGITADYTPGCPTSRTFCNTDDISPLWADCDKAIQSLIDSKTDCFNKNGYGVACNVVAKYGTCGIRTCARATTFPRIFTLSEVEVGYLLINTYCRNGDRVKGYHMFDDQMTSSCAHSTDPVSCAGSAILTEPGYGSVEFFRIYN